MIDWENLRPVLDRPRAPAGGCIGRNNEVYAGGQFLPEHADSLRGEYKRDKKGWYTVRYTIYETVFSTFSNRFVRQPAYMSRKFENIDSAEEFCQAHNGTIDKR